MLDSTIKLSYKCHGNMMDDFISLCCKFKFLEQIMYIKKMQHSLHTQNRDQYIQNKKLSVICCKYPRLCILSLTLKFCLHLAIK